MNIIKGIKLLYNQFKAHPVAIFFLIISYVMSSILISIWTSNSVQIRNLALQKTEGLPQNTLEVVASFGKDINFGDFTHTFENISQETNITFQKVIINLKGTNKPIPISFEYFKNTPNWRYPLLKGKDYTSQDVMNGEKKVLIGKKLDEFTYFEGGAKKIKILDEEFNVAGIIGRKNKDSPWDEQIFMPLKAAPKLSQMQFNGQHAFAFLIKNNNKQPMEDCKVLEKQIKQNNSTFNIRELDTKNDILSTSFSSNSGLTQLTLTVFFFAVINMMNISIYWIAERRKEIGIRKAFGISNFNISYMLFIEIFSVCLISSILGLCLQFGINLFFDKISNYTLTLTIENLFSGIATSFITTFFTVLIPILHSLKIQPIETLKG